MKMHENTPKDISFGLKLLNDRRWEWNRIGLRINHPSESPDNCPYYPTCEPMELALYIKADNDSGLQDLTS